jgi:hypothetical protein
MCIDVAPRFTTSHTLIKSIEALAYKYQYHSDFVQSKMKMKLSILALISITIALSNIGQSCSTVSDCFNKDGHVACSKQKCLRKHGATCKDSTKCISEQCIKGKCAGRTLLQSCDGFDQCNSLYMCSSGKCKVKEGGRCSDTVDSSECVDNLQCMDNTKVCKKTTDMEE